MQKNEPASEQPADEFYDHRQLLIDCIIAEFIAELDKSVCARFVDGRLWWDGVSVRDSAGRIWDGG